MAKVQDRLFLSKCTCTSNLLRPVCDFSDLSKKKLVTLSEKLLSEQIVCVGVGEETQRIVPTFTSLLLPLNRVVKPATDGSIDIDEVVPLLTAKATPKELPVPAQKKKPLQNSCLIDGVGCTAPTGLHFIYPTPFLVNQLITDERTFKLNADLMNIMLELEEENEGCQYHLHDGFRSADGLLTRSDPAIQWLKSEITSRAQYLLSLSNSSHLPLLIDGWGQVLRAGDGQEAHVHPASIFAGVYYIHAPKEVMQPNNSGGCLRLLDPRPGAQMAQVIRGKSLYGDMLEVCPSEQGGTIVLFPSYLMHEVKPMPAHFVGPRIAISFNVLLKV